MQKDSDTIKSPRHIEKVPQHVIDEERADEIKRLRKEQAQMEMYDDPYLNWSGHR